MARIQTERLQAHCGDVDRAHPLRQRHRRVGDDDRAERLERVQSAVRPAAAVGLATWHFEFASWLRVHPDLAALLEIEYAGNAFECIRILGGLEGRPEI